jgi:hypothetical protein
LNEEDEKVFKKFSAQRRIFLTKKKKALQEKIHSMYSEPG